MVLVLFSDIPRLSYFIYHIVNIIKNRLLRTTMMYSLGFFLF